MHGGNGSAYDGLLDFTSLRLLFCDLVIWLESILIRRLVLLGCAVVRR